MVHHVDQSFVDVKWFNFCWNYLLPLIHLSSIVALLVVLGEMRWLYGVKGKQTMSQVSSVSFIFSQKLVSYHHCLLGLLSSQIAFSVAQQATTSPTTICCWCSSTSWRSWMRYGSGKGWYYCWRHFYPRIFMSFWVSTLSRFVFLFSAQCAAPVV